MADLVARRLCESASLGATLMSRLGLTYLRPALRLLSTFSKTNSLLSS
jgi:hypothetical protein